MKCKKIFLKIFIFFMCFCYFKSVAAREMIYEAYDEAFKFEVTTSGVNLLNPGEEETTGGWTTGSYEYYTADFSEYVANANADEPFAMFICKKVDSSQGPGGAYVSTRKFYFFPSEIEKENYEKDYYKQHMLYDNLDEKISGSSKRVCPAVDYLEDDLREIMEGYNGCSDFNCELKTKEELNLETEKFSEVCRTIFKYSDYSSECVKYCLKFDLNIKE